jgi:hypothetical protein
VCSTGKNARRQKKMQTIKTEATDRRRCTFHFPVLGAPEGMFRGVQYSFLSHLTVSAASEREMPADRQSKISSHCGPENEFSSFSLGSGGGGDTLTMAVAVSLLHSFY